MYNVNKTVSMYSQLYLMPPYETSLIMGNLMSGGLILNEFDYYSSGQIIMILIGTLICIFGIFFKVLRVEMVSEDSKFVNNFLRAKNINHKEKVQFPKNCNERIQNDSLDWVTPLKT